MRVSRDADAEPALGASALSSLTSATAVGGRSSAGSLPSRIWKNRDVHVVSFSVRMSMSPPPLRSRVADAPTEAASHPYSVVAAASGVPRDHRLAKRG